MNSLFCSIESACFQTHQAQPETKLPIYTDGHSEWKYTKHWCNLSKLSRFWRANNIKTQIWTQMELQQQTSNYYRLWRSFLSLERETNGYIGYTRLENCTPSKPAPFNLSHVFPALNRCDVCSVLGKHWTFDFLCFFIQIPLQNLLTLTLCLWTHHLL